MDPSTSNVSTTALLLNEQRAVEQEFTA